MAGPNDDHLKWPFEAKITVQIINWKHDRNHVQHTMDIGRDSDAWKREVVDGVVSDGTGWHGFISHKKLLNTSSEDTLYVEDDTIKFRVPDIHCWGKDSTSSNGMLSIILYISWVIRNI